MKREEVDRILTDLAYVRSVETGTQHGQLLQDAIEALRSLTTLRPMEDAPRDGTEILGLYSGGDPLQYRYGIVSWETGEWRVQLAGRIDEPDGWLPLPPVPPVRKGR